MIWRELSRNDAAVLADTWNNYSSDEFMYEVDYWNSELKEELNEDYRKLRENLIKFYEESEAEDSGSRPKEYYRDLLFALKLYNFLDKMGMNASIASNDNVWAYIQMKVVPDLIFERWDNVTEGKRINDDRMWKNSRRIWLKTLWWYVYLSLQNDSLDDTKKILIDNTTDDITQLIERTGGGYRVELYRAIMKRYSKSPNHGRYLLRNVLKLNVVFCSTAEPMLFNSGIEDYVDNLFRYCE